MPKAFPIEFRRGVVAVARKGEAPLAQIAEDFGILESCLHRWLKLAGIGGGVRPAMTSRPHGKALDSAATGLGGHCRRIGSSQSAFQPCPKRRSYWYAS